MRLTPLSRPGSSRCSLEGGSRLADWGERWPAIDRGRCPAPSGLGGREGHGPGLPRSGSLRSTGPDGNELEAAGGGDGSKRRAVTAGQPVEDASFLTAPKLPGPGSAMIHPHTELRFISPEIGWGVFATKPIPKGTVTWVRDELDHIVSPARFRALGPLYRELLEKYTYRDKAGNYILCWDQA